MGVNSRLELTEEKVWNIKEDQSNLLNIKTKEKNTERNEKESHVSMEQILK
jgi:hypothetical protein